jgi:hypothetical protein
VPVGGRCVVLARVRLRYRLNEQNYIYINNPNSYNSFHAVNLHRAYDNVTVDHRGLTRYDNDHNGGIHHYTTPDYFYDDTRRYFTSHYYRSPDHFNSTDDNVPCSDDHCPYDHSNHTPAGYA